MGFLFRSAVVIGAIALHSPVHETRTDTQGLREQAAKAAATATAAREAVEVFAGLDPQTRETLAALALGSLERGGADGRKPLRP